MARGSEPSGRRIRRVAGQRRMTATDPTGTAPTATDPTATDPTANGPAAYAPPAPSAPTPVATPASEPTPQQAQTSVEAPPRPAPETVEPVEHLAAVEPAEGTRTRGRGFRGRLHRPRLTGRGPVRRPALLGVALIGVVVVLLTLVVLLLQGWLHARAVASARADATAQASVAVPQVAAYNYKTFDADTTRAAKLLTPTFRTAYLQVQQQTVRTPAVKYQAAVTADLVSIGAISGNSTDVKFLVFLDQTTTNTRLSAPRLSQNRLHVEMRKVHGHWLIAQMELF
jgi:Mce-associated membrane protein